MDNCSNLDILLQAAGWSPDTVFTHCWETKLRGYTVMVSAYTGDTLKFSFFENPVIEYKSLSESSKLLVDGGVLSESDLTAIALLGYK